MSNIPGAQSEENFKEKVEDSEMEQVYKNEDHNIEELNDELNIFSFIIQPVIRIQILEQNQLKFPNLINEQADKIQILGENKSQLPILTNEPMDQMQIVAHVYEKTD
jgi:hypothetical protein